MSRNTTHKRRRPGRAAQASAQQRRRWLLATVAAAVVGVAVLIVIGQAQPTPTAAAVPTAGKIKGDAAAPVTIDEWADFQCPACRALTLGVARQLDDSFVKDGTVKVVWHNLAFLGPESGWAAQAANCADEQGRFWDYHDKLYAEQAGENRGAFRKDNLKRFAASLGLDQPAFNACLDSDRYAGAVKAETDAGKDQAVRSTPTLFVNGQKIEGVPRFEQLRDVILAQAAAAGVPPAGAPAPSAPAADASSPDASSPNAPAPEAQP